MLSYDRCAVYAWAETVCMCVHDIMNTHTHPYTPVHGKADQCSRMHTHMLFVCAIRGLNETNIDVKRDLCTAKRDLHIAKRDLHTSKRDLHTAKRDFN